MKVALSVGLAFFCLAANSRAQPANLYNYTISTPIGSYPSGDGGMPTAALLGFPEKVAVTSNGVVYIADTYNHRVRKVAGGKITTVAGTGEPGFAGDGGPAISAKLSYPGAVAVDGSGDIYIYDTGNQVIRKVDAGGNMSTVAGTPANGGTSGDGGPATSAKFALGVGGGIAVDKAGNIYISDFNNSAVREVNVSTGMINTIAGTLGSVGRDGDGKAATSAHLFYPTGLSFDSNGNLYIADSQNAAIRMVSAQDKTINTVAGTLGAAGVAGDGGPAKSANLNLPYDVAVDSQGNLYIADLGNNKIRKVTAGANPMISTLAGTGAAGFAGDGGSATAALLLNPYGVAVDANSTVYICDTINSRVRTVQGGTIGEFAGEDHDQGDKGPASDASLYFPSSIAWDTQGNLYIADTDNNRIRKVTTDGNVDTIAGNGSFATSGDGGPALMAGVTKPAAVAVDSKGNVYIAANHQIRMVDTKGNITTVVNTADARGFQGDGQAATSAELNSPLGLAIDSSDTLYIADTYNHRIRKVSDGVISTVAGSGPICLNPCNTGSFGGDGSLATNANLSFPYEVAFDSAGNMLIDDAKNFVIRKVDAKSAKISTIAGTPGKAGFGGDLGPATSALLNNPIGVAVDSSGNLYISDASNGVVRIVDALGVISTIAGDGKPGYSGDGGPAIMATVNLPFGVLTDSSGNVWFVDQSNHRVRKLTPSGPQVGNGPLGVVNAASFVAGGIVPGGMATLFGSNLTNATGINLAGSLPLGIDLLNSSVKFNNAIAAPLFAVDNVNGQQQINFQVPWELSALVGGTVVLQVSNNGALSTPVAVPVLAAQPGVFSYTVGSTTFGVVLHANFQLADSAHPVTPGEVVLIYCTNLGAVSPAIADGAPGTGNEQTVKNPVVTIGGAAADVSFSGLAPGFVGLNQVNVKVPTGLAATNQPLVITMGGVSGKTVMVPVGK